MVILVKEQALKLFKKGGRKVKNLIAVVFCLAFLTFFLGTAAASTVTVTAGSYDVTLTVDKPNLSPLVLSGPSYIGGIECSTTFFSEGANTIYIIQSGTDFSQMDFSQLAEAAISTDITNYGEIKTYTVNGRQWAATSGTGPVIGGVATGGTRYSGCTLINNNAICMITTFSTPKEFKQVVHSLQFASAGGNLLN